jgi:hypothetical protein
LTTFSNDKKYRAIYLLTLISNVFDVIPNHSWKNEPNIDDDSALLKQAKLMIISLMRSSYN